jgi:hypothetical protein
MKAAWPGTSVCSAPLPRGSGSGCNWRLPPLRNRLQTRMRAADVDEPWYGISAYDPLDYVKKTDAPRSSFQSLPWISARGFRNEHPGMALLYFSVPVMVLFSLGLPIIQHMGMSAVRMGAYYMYVYTFCALTLLTITCLRQLRAYFRVRYVNMPQALPWFWLGTAAMMILIIMWGAVNLPMPSLPPVAYVDKHEVDVFNPMKLRVELQPVTPPTMSFMERYQLAERLDIVAKIAIFWCSCIWPSRDCNGWWIICCATAMICRPL